MTRFGLVATGAAALVAQAVPSASPEGIGALVGQLGTAGIIVGFSLWRLRQQDETIKAKDAELAALNRLITTEVVPALRDTAHAANEVRASMASLLDANRRDQEALFRRVADEFRQRDR